MKHIVFFLLLSTLIISCETESFTPEPLVGFEIDLESQISDKSVQFINQSEFAESYRWDFGDGSESDEISPMHHYKRGGSYTVTLKAYNAIGENIASKEITVKQQATYRVFNNSTMTLNNVRSYYLDGEEKLEVFEHGTIEPGAYSEIIPTSREKINVAFENDMGLPLYVCFPYTIEGSETNDFEIHEYTMVFTFQP